MTPVNEARRFADHQARQQRLWLFPILPGRGYGSASHSGRNTQPTETLLDTGLLFRRRRPTRALPSHAEAGQPASAGNRAGRRVSSSAGCGVARTCGSSPVCRSPRPAPRSRASYIRVLGPRLGGRFLEPSTLSADSLITKRNLDGLDIPQVIQQIGLKILG
jgi:hypothetical protein